MNEQCDRSCARTGLVLLLMLGVAVASRADDQSQVPADTGTAVSVEAPATNAAAAGGQSTEDAARAEQAQRLQKFRQLSFDRLPGSMLQALQQHASGTAPPTNELALLQWCVTLNDWPGVARLFESWPPGVSTQLYTEFIRQVQRPPRPQGRRPEEQPDQSQATPRPGGQPSQSPVWFWSDVLGLADAAPCALAPEQLDVLGRLLQQTLINDVALSNCVHALELGTRRLGGADPAARRAAGNLLAAAEQYETALAFLPPPAVAARSNDARSVAVHIQYLADQARRTQVTTSLHAAWSWAFWALTNDAGDASARRACLAAVLPPPLVYTGTVPLAAWMDEVKTNAARGALFLAALADAAERTATSTDGTARSAWLALNAQALDAVAAAPWLAEPACRHAAAVLALGWLREAEQTIDRYQRPQLRPRNYPPYYYSSRREESQGARGPAPLTPGALLAALPGGATTAAFDTALGARLADARTRLLIRDADYSNALAAIAALPRQQTARTRALASALLHEWLKDRKPNADEQNDRYYNGPYGSQRPQGIPLTRTLQQRNMAELAQMYPELCRAGVSTAALVQAFCNAHSDAEVFAMSDITNVFGDRGVLAGATLVELAGQMRQRLATQWREPQTQRQSGTKRTDRDIQAELVRGYGLLTNLLADALQATPDDWQLHQQFGAVLFDWAEYDYGRDVDVAVYNAKRRDAFAAFARAAACYAADVPALPPSAWTTAAYMQWFNAALGASDAAYLTRQHEPSPQQLDTVRAALDSLPAPALAAHRAAFAHAIDDTLTNLKPEFKSRYVRAAKRIIGDDPAADTIRALDAYYDGLLNDLALECRLDGSGSVGHTQEFGVLLTLQHTAALEREAGGFGRYLRNARSAAGYYYVYGQEPIDYRDNLEQHIREAFDHGFWIKSITFSDPNVTSRGCARDGWRETPLAYLVLAAKDAAVDHLPAVQMDLDFLDMNSKVLLPIESPIVPIDARVDAAPPRPVTNLTATFLLDEREARDDVFTLEIDVSALGLIPDLAHLAAVQVPGFVVESETDSGTRVKQLDTVSNETATVVCDRTWTLRLRPEPGARRAPSVFRFPACTWPGARVAYKRYADADIIDVPREVAIAGVRLRSSWWLLWLVPAVVVAGAAGVALLAWRQRARRHVVACGTAAIAMPAQCTPFSVLRLLQDIERAAQTRMTAEERAALAADITTVQAAYFAPPDGAGVTPGAPPLEELARNWVAAANAAN